MDRAVLASRADDAHHRPSYYDTPTFSALIVAGAVSVLGGMVAAPLSVLYWKSTDKPVALESQNPV